MSTLITLGFLALAVASPWIAELEHGLFLVLLVLIPAAFLLLATRRRAPGLRPVWAVGIGLCHLAVAAWMAVVLRRNSKSVSDWQFILVASAGALWLVVGWVARRR